MRLLKLFVFFALLFFTSLIEANENKTKFHNHKENIAEIKKNAQKQNIFIDKIKPLLNTEIYYFEQNSKTYFINKELSFIIEGNAAEIKNGVLNTGSIDKEKRIKAYNIISTLNINDLIIYKSEKEKQKIFIITDFTCPYCKILHNDYLDYFANQGISVIYIPFSRNKNNQKLKEDMVNIFCLKENEQKKEIIEKAFNNKIKNNIEECETPSIYYNYYMNIGSILNITGTPTIIDETGYIINGLKDKSDIMKLISGKNE